MFILLENTYLTLYKKRYLKLQLVCLWCFITNKIFYQSWGTRVCGQLMGILKCLYSCLIYTKNETPKPYIESDKKNRKIINTFMLSLFIQYCLYFILILGCALITHLEAFWPCVDRGWRPLLSLLSPPRRQGHHSVSKAKESSLEMTKQHFEIRKSNFNI